MRRPRYGRQRRSVRSPASHAGAGDLHSRHLSASIALTPAAPLFADSSFELGAQQQDGQIPRISLHSTLAPPYWEP